MGFFSKCCAKTNLPVLAADAWGRNVPRLTRIVVLQQGDKPFTAEYDGYGLHLGDDFESAKFVLEDVYQGERWEDLPESGYEPNQGFFHDQQFLVAIAALPNGFATHADYIDALDALEEDWEADLENAMSKLDIPPPKDLYVPMLEYLNYLSAGRWDSAQFYVDRHPAVLDWLPSDRPGQEAQAHVLQQAVADNSRMRVEKAMAAYQAKLAPLS